MTCCSFEKTVDRQFGPAKVRQELERYHRRGAGPTARMLVAGIVEARLVGTTVLDIGGGIGSLTFALLEKGAPAAVIVEASAAYADVAATEAARRGHASTVRVVRGDFLDEAGEIVPAGVVTLDRVVCCYARYAELLAAALQRAERGFAFSYPRDRWYVRAVMRVDNLLRQRKSGFQTFVHPEGAMLRLIEGAGFKRVSHAHSLAWAADVFMRA